LDDGQLLQKVAPAEFLHVVIRDQEPPPDQLVQVKVLTDNSVAAGVDVYNDAFSFFREIALGAEEGRYTPAALLLVDMEIDAECAHSDV
jgi:hypothetical protein